MQCVYHSYVQCVYQQCMQVCIHQQHMQCVHHAYVLVCFFHSVPHCPPMGHMEFLMCQKENGPLMLNQHQWHCKDALPCNLQLIYPSASLVHPGMLALCIIDLGQQSFPHLHSNRFFLTKAKDANGLA